MEHPGIKAMMAATEEEDGSDDELGEPPPTMDRSANAWRSSISMGRKGSVIASVAPPLGRGPPRLPSASQPISGLKGKQKIGWVPSSDAVMEDESSGSEASGGAEYAPRGRAESRQVRRIGRSWVPVFDRFGHERVVIGRGILDGFTTVGRREDPRRFAVLGSVEGEAGKYASCVSRGRTIVTDEGPFC